MKKMKENIGNIKTTILGIFLIILAIAYFVYPYIHTNAWKVNEWYSVSLFIGGVGFIVSPDKIIQFMFGWLEKFLPKSK